MTSALASKVEEGDLVLVRGPYGRFGEKRSTGKDEVWLAGGIGITPFLSMLQEERQRPSGSKILLIWSYRVHEELPYEEEIFEYLRSLPMLTFVHWNTSERGRLGSRSISELLDNDLQSRRFKICGPRAMMRSLGKQLVAEGVRPVDVILEDFNLV
jgi:ferredoxin-NADP reductase